MSDVVPSIHNSWTLLYQDASSTVEVDLFPTYEAAMAEGEEMMKEYTDIERIICVPPTHGEVIADA